MPKFARPTSYTGSQSNQNHTGTARAATPQEVTEAESEQLYISPATLASAVTSVIASATSTRAGVVLLTDDHTPVATKFYVDSVGVSNASILQLLASPPVIGSVLPAAGAFTSLSAKNLQIKSGLPADYAGKVNLVNGVATIANPNVKTGDMIFLSRVSGNASTMLGELTYTIVNNTSFSIKSVALNAPGSTQVSDQSTIIYNIIRPI
jgi:hypothetical protein